jgi:hypothetical protein
MKKRSKEFKLQMMKEALKVGNKTLAARRYAISSNCLQTKNVNGEKCLKKVPLPMKDTE